MEKHRIYMYHLDKKMKKQVGSNNSPRVGGPFSSFECSNYLKFLGEGTQASFGTANGRI